ncbi:methyl-accepting chemotaxis protein [Aquabacterium sp. A3]|uniref:methyl-accepting chemotaxis protein n=1 Tax=Aquabacterium sp. A3 TaxID=3132829 RepID=UPI00311923C6
MLARMSIANRLYLGFGLLIVLMVAVTTVATRQVSSIRHALTENSQINVPIQRYAINFRGSAHDRSIAIRDEVLAQNAADRQREAERINELASFYAKSATPLEALIEAPDADPALKALYADIQDIEQRTVSTTQAIQRLLEEGRADEAQARLWQDAKPQYEAWLAAINRLIDHQEAQIQAQGQLALQQASSFLMVMLGTVALALLVSGPTAWRISRSVLNQLGAEPAQLEAVTMRMAQGDLQPIAEARHARQGSVLASLGAMQQDLSRLVGQVRAAAGNVAEGTTQIASGNTDLSRRTEAQASSLQQTASATQQLAQAVETNAETATQANLVAGKASQAATKGGMVVSDVVQTMRDIHESSRKIADIIGVIDGIAFQTNILALNAAVEAARAGEQGRGFAVVASEVRGLAQRSANAAREIKDLIHNSLSKVENGSTLVENAGQAMDEIVTQVQQVTTLITRITNASVEQQSGISQVGQALQVLNQTTQQNADLVQQSASASGHLQSQASELANTVKVFKLG